jgi:rRNA maturation protein Nop10
MWYEHSDNSPPKPPHCPGCGQVMRLARITSRFDELPELYTFECLLCGVSHVEAALMPHLSPHDRAVKQRS